MWGWRKSSIGEGLIAVVLSEAYTWHTILLLPPIYLSFPSWYSYLLESIHLAAEILPDSWSTAPAHSSYRAGPAALPALEQACKFCCIDAPLALLKLNASRDSRGAGCIFWPAWYIYISKFHSYKLLNLKMRQADDSNSHLNNYCWQVKDQLQFITQVWSVPV